jgi:hypothetical protein
VWHSIIYTIYYWDDEIKEDEMGWTCGSHEDDEKYMQNFGWIP